LPIEREMRRVSIMIGVEPENIGAIHAPSVADALEVLWARSQERRV
jgi:hypothetical protein